MAGLGFRVSPEAPMAYSNKSLVHNWYEDRFQEKVAQGLGMTLKDMGTKERVTCKDFPGDHPGLFETTQRAAERTMMTTPAPKTITRPSLISQANLEDRLATYGHPASLHYTIGANALQEAQKPVERHLTTTNKAFYEGMPAMATTRNPEYYQTDVKSHALNSALDRDTWTRTAGPGGEVQTLGGKGARGEITRNPKEGGNVYGVSVFVDEYAKWGSALQGVPLGETVSKKQTKYF